jgi:hypothetical protein
MTKAVGRSIAAALVLLVVAACQAGAQCVMCFRTAAAQQTERAHVLNHGIIILGIPPFLILAGFLLLAYRKRRA